MATLEKEFAKIREQGYAIDQEESVKGACCIGAPVRDYTGTVVASISASLVTDHFFRWDESRLASVIKSAAAELSAAIGYETKSLPSLMMPTRRMAAGRG